MTTSMRNAGRVLDSQLGHHDSAARAGRPHLRRVRPTGLAALPFVGVSESQESSATIQAASARTYVPSPESQCSARMLGRKQYSPPFVVTNLGMPCKRLRTG